jgi:hypothetical protein
VKVKTSRDAASCECGASSSEFAFAIMVLAVAIGVGGLGGVWIAKREGLQKPKATEPSQVTEQRPPEQPAEQPQGDKKPDEAPLKTIPAKTPEVKPPAVRPAPKPGGPELPSVEAIRYSSQAGSTEVTIELGAASLVRAAGLPNPDRVYFDLQTDGQAAHPRGRLDAQNAKDIEDDGLLAGIRVARWKSGDIRVVFDLRRPCDFSYKISPQSASRLVVELKAR